MAVVGLLVSTLLAVVGRLLLQCLVAEEFLASILLAVVEGRLLLQCLVVAEEFLASILLAAVGERLLRCLEVLAVVVGLQL